MFNLFSKIGKICKHEIFLKRAKRQIVISVKLVKNVKFKLAPYNRLSTYFHRQSMYLLEKISERKAPAQLI